MILPLLWMLVPSLASGGKEVKLQKFLQHKPVIGVRSIVGDAVSKSYAVNLEDGPYVLREVFNVHEGASTQGDDSPAQVRYEPIVFVSRGDTLKNVAFSGDGLVIDKQGSFCQHVFYKIDSIEDAKCQNLSKPERIGLVQQASRNHSLHFVDPLDRRCYQRSVELVTDGKFWQGTDSLEREALLGDIYRQQAQTSRWRDSLVHLAIGHYEKAIQSGNRTPDLVFWYASLLLLGNTEEVQQARQLIESPAMVRADGSKDWQDLGRALLAFRQRNWCQVLALTEPLRRVRFQDAVAERLQRQSRIHLLGRTAGAGEKGSASSTKKACLDREE